MTLDELIHELGGNVFQKHAVVEEVEPVTNPENLRIGVRITDPGVCPVDRVGTWLVKMDGEEVRCILMPSRFRILLTEEFYLEYAEVFPMIQDGAELLRAIPEHVKVGDELIVLHISPALHAGKYCTFDEAAA